MNRTHFVIVRPGSSFIARAGTWIIALAVIWMAASPRPMWGQWTGTNPVWTNSNVGIGTTNPQELLQTQTVDNNPSTYLGATTGGLEIWPYFNYGGNLYGAWLRSLNAAHTAYEPLAITGATIMLMPVGNVGIGTTNPQYLLSVKGTAGAEEFIVTNTGWSDYVFQPGYHLRSLSEVNAYIQANHHLPDIPSEAEVRQKGVSVGDMQAKLLAKVEELTLHMIQAEERSNRLERQNQELRDRLASLEKNSNTTPKAAK